MSTQKYFISLTDVSENLLTNDLITVKGDQLVRCVIGADLVVTDEVKTLSEADQEGGVFLPIPLADYVPSARF